MTERWQFPLTRAGALAREFPSWLKTVSPAELTLLLSCIADELDARGLGGSLTIRTAIGHVEGVFRPGTVE